MDPTLEKLMGIVNKDAVTVQELRDGIVYCFCVVNRAYMKAGAMEIGEDSSDRVMDKMMHLLAREVSANINMDFEQPAVEGLKKLKDALDERLQFSSKDPVIFKKHEEVIGKLFQSAVAR